MKNLFRSLLICFGVFSFCGCASTKSMSADDLYGTSWQIEFINIAKDIKIPDRADRPVYFSFIHPERIAGMSGVNRFNAQISMTEVAANEFSIKVGPAASTMMAGPFLDYERVFLTNLQSSDRMLVSGNQLKFFQGQKLLLAFTRNDDLK